MSEDTIDKKIDFAKFVINHNVELINFADTKASAILATAGVILGLLLFLDIEKISLLIIVEVIVTVVLLGATIVYSFSVILPRLIPKTKTETAIFYKSIIQQTKDEFKENFKNMDLNSILDDCLGNIHALANIQNKKYTQLRMSLFLMLYSIISLIITLITYFII